MTAREIFELVREDLAQVEREIAAQSDSGIEPVAEIGRYLLAGGGKRLRPALLLLSARCCGYQGPGAIRLGAVVELIHSATLIHDDVIDGADTRRGRPSANSRWGNHMSVLAGDWLYMQSFQLALAERNFRILDILIELTQQMVEGELIQLTKLGSIQVTEQDALELAYRKTACLFRGCMQLGAVLGRQEESVERALADYGRYAGLAFQFVDDLLDFTASPEQLGKPVLSDLKEGKVTLPLIFALQNGAPAPSAPLGAGAAGAPGSGEPDAGLLVAAVLAEKGFQSVRPEQIVRLVERSGALERTRRVAHEFADKAKACMAGFDDSEYSRALRSIPDFILERES